MQTLIPRWSHREVSIRQRTGAIGHPLAGAVEDQEADDVRSARNGRLLVVGDQQPVAAAADPFGLAAAVDVERRRVLPRRGHLLERRRGEIALDDRVGHADGRDQEGPRGIAVRGIALDLEADPEGARVADVRPARDLDSPSPWAEVALQTWSVGICGCWARAAPAARSRAEKTAIRVMFMKILLSRRLGVAKERDVTKPEMGSASPSYHRPWGLGDHAPAALRDDSEAFRAGFGGELGRELSRLAEAAARQRQLGLEETALQLVGHEAAAPCQLQPCIDQCAGGVELSAREEHLHPGPPDQEGTERFVRRGEERERPRALAVGGRQIAGRELGQGEAGARAGLEGDLAPFGGEGDRLARMLQRLGAVPGLGQPRGEVGMGPGHAARVPDLLPQRQDLARVLDRLRQVAAPEGDVGQEAPRLSGPVAVAALEVALQALFDHPARLGQLAAMEPVGTDRMEEALVAEGAVCLAGLKALPHQTVGAQQVALVEPGAAEVVEQRSEPPPGSDLPVEIDRLATGLLAPGAS